MAGVDAELRWGDERLELSRHELDAVIEPEHGPFCLRPFEPVGDDLVLTIPARAKAWVRTANGMRDLATLRVLGQIAPHPRIEGAAQVRLRKLEAAEGIVEGIVLTSVVEAWIGIDGWWLGVKVTEATDEAAPPRFEPRALRADLWLAAFVLTLLTGALSALGAVPPREASLGIGLVDVRAAARLPLVSIAAFEHALARRDTKHDVPPRAAGGGDVLDALAPPAPTPARRAAPPPGDGAQERPAPAERTVAASSRGPSEGYGGGLGRPLARPAPRVRFRGSMIGCERTWNGACRAPMDDPARRVAIAAVVRRHFPEVRACYERGLVREAGLAGRLTLRWSIDADGVVRNVEVVGDELRAPAVTECMRRRPIHWRFPSAVGPADVRYPFFFRAAEVTQDGSG